MSIEEMFRSPKHPGQADTLVHFCARARQDFAPEVAFLSPQGRLEVLLREERFLAKEPYGSTTKAVCFSECDSAHVEALLRAEVFPGWGVVVKRDWAWGQGGGPVWYARDDVWRQITEPRIRTWMVRTQPQHADWLYEREWRIPVTEDWLELVPGDVHAVLISDPDWDILVAAGVSEEEQRRSLMRPIVWACAERWFWDGRQISKLPPLGTWFEADDWH